MHPLAAMKTPIFWAENHPGPLSREDWKVEISGLCAHPHIFTWKELLALPKSIAHARLTSVTRWSVKGKWGGVQLKRLLDIVSPDSSVTYVRFWSVGKIYDTSIPREIAEKERTLLAYDFNDTLLTEDYGGPVRIFCPYLWGYKSAKSVVHIELMDHYEKGYWERRGYSDSAEIKAGKIYDVNNEFQIRSIPDGEVIDFK